MYSSMNASTLPGILATLAPRAREVNTEAFADLGTAISGSSKPSLPGCASW